MTTARLMANMANEVKESKAAKDSTLKFDLSLLPQSLICPVTKKPFKNPCLLSNGNTVDKSAIKTDKLAQLQPMFRFGDKYFKYVEDAALKSMANDFLQLFNDLSCKSNDLSKVEVELQTIHAEVNNKLNDLSKLENEIRRFSPSIDLKTKRYKKDIKVNEEPQETTNSSDQSVHAESIKKFNERCKRYESAVVTVQGEYCSQSDIDQENKTAANQTDYVINNTLRLASKDCPDKFLWFKEHLMKLDQQYETISRQISEAMQANVDYAHDIKKMTSQLDKVKMQTIIQDQEKIIKSLRSNVSSLKRQVKQFENKQRQNDEEDIVISEPYRCCQY